MRQKLTPKQLSVYVFMKDYLRENDMLPTGEEIAKFLGATTAACGHAHIHSLVDKGYLEPSAAPRKFRLTREPKQQMECA